MNRIIFLLFLMTITGCASTSNQLKSGSSNVWDLETSTYQNSLNLPAIEIEFNCTSSKEYKVKYRAGASGSWSTGPTVTCSTGGSVNNYVIQPLICNTEYEIKVKRRNRFNWDRAVQKTLPCYSTPNTNTNTADTVRLKQVATGKCVYGYQTPGTSDTKAYTWDCYENPGMAFKMIVHPTSGKNKFQHQETSKCLTVNNTNGAHAYLIGCHLASTFILEPVTGNEVRLKAEGKNKCLYGHSQNGRPVNAWDCWNDPAMNFILEPY